MRIGIDVTPLTRDRTGVGEYTASLLQRLLQQAPDCTFHGFSTGLSPLDPAALEGLSSHRRLPIPTRAMYKLWTWTGRPRVDTLLGGLDLYHATNFFLPPVATARRVVTFHDLAYLRVPHLCSPKIVQTFSRSVRRFAREADGIVACSAATKRDMVELLGTPEGKIHVIHEAADEIFTPHDPEAARGYLQEHYGLTGPLVLFVGTLEPRKNVEGILAAFAQACPAVPHCLVLVGKLGWNLPRLPERISELGLENRCRLIGYVQSREDLPRFYSAADAFVFPSFYEGFGLPVLEAMACGCPVICSSAASLPEVAGDAAEYIDPNDTGQLSDALHKVLLNESRRRTMAERGIAQARRFSWSRCAEQTYEVYKALAPS